MEWDGITRVRQGAGMSRTRCVGLSRSGTPASSTPCAGVMLVQRRRRWSNITPAPGQCIVCVGGRH